MLRALLVVSVALIGTASSMKTRFNRKNEKTMYTFILDIFSLVLPTVMIIGIVIAVAISVKWYMKRKPAESDETFETFEEIEKRVSAILSAQNHLKRDVEHYVQENATEAVQKLLQMEMEIKHRRQRNCKDILKRVKLHCEDLGNQVEEIATAMDERMTHEQSRQKERKTEVEDLLQEWKRMKGHRMAETSEATISYIGHLAERPEKTYYPQDLTMSLPAWRHKDLKTL